MFVTTSWITDLLLIIVGGFLLIYKYSTRKFDHWKKRAVPYVEPLPVFGNAKDIFFFRRTAGDWMKELYDNSEGDYKGIFIFDEPALLITSPHLIKKIMIQDFNYFMDRTLASPDHNELFSYVLFFQKAPEWKTFRSKLTPIFTSGKLKAMFPFVQGIAENLVQYLHKNLGVQEAKEICCKYATDIICKCAFGINAHCLEDERAVFRMLSKSMTEFSLRNAICQSSYWFRQSWVKWFKLDFFAPWIQEYFRDAFWQTMKTRREMKVKANDLIDLLKDMMDKQEIPDFGKLFSQHF